jgi:hypothetical protein
MRSGASSAATSLAGDSMADGTFAHGCVFARARAGAVTVMLQRDG